MEKPIIRISGLKKDFTFSPGLFSTRRSVVHAVDDVSLDIHEDEIVGLIGERGSARRRSRACCWAFRRRAAAVPKSTDRTLPGQIKRRCVPSVQRSRSSFRILCQRTHGE